MQLSQREYYTAPSDKVFDDIKATAIKLWSTFDNTHGYASEKIARIKDLENIQDNYAYIAAMFDPGNRAILAQMLELQESKNLLFKLM